MWNTYFIYISITASEYFFPLSRYLKSADKMYIFLILFLFSSNKAILPRVCIKTYLFLIWIKHFFCICLKFWIITYPYPKIKMYCSKMSTSAILEAISIVLRSRIIYSKKVLEKIQWRKKSPHCQFYNEKSLF